MPPEPRREIRVDSVRLSLGRRAVFQDLSCRFPAGRISIVMGGSGSGKTTLLRLLAGLQRADAGRVVVGGEEISSLAEASLARVRRRIGMLFQRGALLDSMSVFENVALPLREHTRLSEDEIAAAVHARLAAVGLEDVDDLLPGELSGGMLRRAALARAIVLDPEILLCDEPFSGLDPANVDRIESLLMDLHRGRQLSLIVTSHHPRVSLRMADQLILLQDGSALSGAPGELAERRDPRVLAFFGSEASELRARPEAS